MNQQQYSWQPEKNKNEEIDELWTESEVAEARFQWKILILFGSVLLKIHSLQTFEIKGCQENWVNKEESLVQSRPGKILSTQYRVSNSYWYFRAASREGLTSSNTIYQSSQTLKILLLYTYPTLEGHPKSDLVR